MADHSDDAPREQRRSSVLPPFFAPRQREITTPTRPVGVTKRRTSQLFTPPGVDRQSRPTFRATPVTPATPPTPPTPLAPAMPEPEPERPIASGERELSTGPARQTPSAPRVAERHAERGDDLQVIAYDDAGALLEPQAHEGEQRRVDGLEIEDTEWSFDGAASAEKLEVESFWAAEPLRPSRQEDEPVRRAPAPPEVVPEPRLEGTLADGEPAGDRLAEAAPSGQQAWGGWPAGSWGEGAGPADVSADVAAGNGDQTSPAMSAADELSAALGWPDADDVGIAHTHDLPPASDEGALAAVEPELRDSAAPFAADASREALRAKPRTMPPAEPSPASPVPGVAEALERIAQRIREGGVPLPADAAAESDAGALAVALAALLRGAPR